MPELFKIRHFLLSFIFTFLIFGFLLNFFAAGLSNWQLFQLSNLSGKLVLFANTLLAVFGIGRTLTDFLFLTAITTLQSILFGLLFFTLHYRRQNLTDNLQRTGIVASFFLLASGCPTCGTALLAPILISLLGSSGLALVGTVSVVLNLVSVLLALYVFQKIGYESYIILEDQKYQSRHRQSCQQPPRLNQTQTCTNPQALDEQTVDQKKHK